MQKYKTKELDIKHWRRINPIELASWVHAEFIKIQPFTEGNGKIARLLLNFVLMSNSYLPIIIKQEDKQDYYRGLDIFAKEDKLDDFYKLIFEKEFEILEKYKKYI